MRSIAAIWSYLIFLPAFAIADDIRLFGPSEVAAGSTLTIDYVGAVEVGDQIGITVPKLGAFVRHAYADPDFESVSLTAPVQPGNYIVVYRRKGRSIAAATISVLPTKVSLTGPAIVGLNERFAITWSGPAYAHDSIRVFDSQGSQVSGSTVNVSSLGAKTIEFDAPRMPGRYFVRYLIQNESVAAWALRSWRPRPKHFGA